MIKTIQIRTKNEKELQKVIDEYIESGWKLVSKTMDRKWNPWMGKVFTVPTWSLTFSKPDQESQCEQKTFIDELRKAKELLDSGAITKEEYEILKMKILNK